MKEYFVEKPMPQFGEDVYSCIPIPDEIVARIRKDAIDELNSVIHNLYVKCRGNYQEFYNAIKEQLKEQSNDD